MNLHDELGRHGADAAAESASRLESGAVRQALGARVRSGRRRRAVGGGAGVVAGVALVAVGVWGILPGTALKSEPAGPVVPGGVTYEVDETAVIDKIMPVDLRMPQEMQCGFATELRSGVTVHDPSAVDAGFVISAATELMADDGSRSPSPSSVVVGTEALAFRYEASARDLTGVQWYTMPMLLQNGEIVGMGAVNGVAGDGEMTMSGPDDAWAPEPGSCLSGGQVEGLGDGAYEPVLVTQLWSASLMQPLATVVFSAGDVEYMGMGEPAPVPDPGNFPGVEADDYLAEVMAVREWSGGLGCEAVLDGVGEGADQGAVVQEPAPVPPVPSWIETGRLYGWGDDVLVGGYPIPLPSSDDGWTDPAAAQLVLSANGDYWLFDARWVERDDLAHDEPGWFVELNQVEDCGHSAMIGRGTYTAQLIYDTAEGGLIADLSPVTVVRGVPSVPEVDAQG